MSQFKVFDDRGNGLNDIPLRFFNGSGGSSEQAIFDFKTNTDGTQTWPLPFWPSPPNPVHVWVNTGDYRRPEYNSDERVLTDANDQLFTLIRAPKTLSRLVSINHAKHRMVNERGELVYGRGAGFFLGFKKHLDDIDIDPQLDQLEGLNCNLVRLMGMFESLGGFDPRPYGPRYYTEIPVFMDRLARRGIHGLWTACAATGKFFNDDQAMQHIHQTVEALLSTQGAVFSPVNEQEEHNNSIDRDRFKRELMDTGKLGWMIYDTGSFGVDKAVKPPFGLYAPAHVRRDYPSGVKDCGTIDHTNRVQNGLEIGVDEPYRMGDEGSGDRHEDSTVARESAGIAYNALYFVAHSMQGERADLLTGNTLDCVSAAMDAMKGH